MLPNIIIIHYQHCEGYFDILNSYILFRYLLSSRVTFSEHLQHIILTPFTMVTTIRVINMNLLHIMLD